MRVYNVVALDLHLHHSLHFFQGQAYLGLPALLLCVQQSVLLQSNAARSIHLSLRLSFVLCVYKTPVVPTHRHTLMTQHVRLGVFALADFARMSQIHLLLTSYQLSLYYSLLTSKDVRILVWRFYNQFGLSYVKTCPSHTQLQQKFCYHQRASAWDRPTCI